MKCAHFLKECLQVKWQGKWHSFNESLTLSRHVLDIIYYVALFYVVHEVTLRFNCHTNFLFFSRKNQLFLDLLYRVTMPRLFYSTQIVVIFIFMLQFVTLRTLKNPSASHLAEFDTTLKFLRITDQ